MKVNQVSGIIRYNYRQALCQSKKDYSDFNLDTINYWYTIGYMHALNDLLECFGFEKEDYSNITFINDLSERIPAMKHDLHYDIANRVLSVKTTKNVSTMRSDG